MSKYTKNSYKKKFRIKIIYQANTVRPENIRQIGEALFFFNCYKLQFTTDIYAHNVTVSTGIKQTRENIQVEKDMH